MNITKYDYLKALKDAENKKDEFDIGSELGLSEEQTKEFIDELLSEGKISHQSFGICSYAVN